MTSIKLMAVDKHCEDKEDIDKNEWYKMSETAKNAGYREGITIGKESVFQAGFDAGYEQGFKIGFDLGTYHGLSRSSVHSLKDGLEGGKQNSSSEELNIIGKPTSQNCQICIDADLLNNSIKDVSIVQEKCHKIVVSKLKAKYELDVISLGIDI